VSQQRVRKIVSDALERRQLDDRSDHALLQLVRLEGAHELAAEAVHGGDLKAIRPYLKVLETIDRYQKAGAESRVRRRRAGKAVRQGEPRRRAPRSRTGPQGAPGPARGEVRRRPPSPRLRFRRNSLKNKDVKF
jgi:hypothetical protein